MQLCSQESFSPTSLLLFGQEETNWADSSHTLSYFPSNQGTIVQDFSGFSKIITKDLSSVVVIQNKTPAAVHVLPPGFLKLKLNGDVKDVADEYIHTGGWAIIHEYAVIYLATIQCK